MPEPELIHETKDYTLRRARYAKGCVALTPVEGEDLKLRASRLAEGLNARWSVREGAYIMSESKGRRFVQLFADRFDSGLEWNSKGVRFVLDQKPAPIRIKAMKRQVKWLKPVANELGKVVRKSKCGRYQIVTKKYATMRKGSFTNVAYEAQRADGTRIGRDAHDKLSDALDEVEMDHDPNWEPGTSSSVPKPLVCASCRDAEKKSRKGGLARYSCRGCGRTLCHHFVKNRDGNVGSCSKCSQDSRVTR